MSPHSVDQSPGEKSGIELLHRWYQVPVLLVLMGYMFWVRFIPFERLIRDGDYFFIGNDAFYHFRTTNYVVENWPFTMPYDPWTHYPYGTQVGQFGTIFDQLIATVALVIGLGDPSSYQVAVVFILAPGIIGTLCAIPTYLLGKRLGGRLSGLFAVAVLAFLPGMFLNRTIVGFTDHHALEIFTQLLAVLTTMVAVYVAGANKPVYEQFVERDWSDLRGTIAWSVLSGVLIAFYIWTWPPGIVLVGILGIFYFLILNIKLVTGQSPEHIAIVATLSLGTTAVLTLLTVESFEVGGTTSLSFLQPILAGGVGIGSAVMAWIAREWERRDLDPIGYPAAISGIGVVGLIFLYFVLPGLVDTLWTNVLRTMALGQSDTALTIGEAQSTVNQPSGLSAYMFGNYGFTYMTGIIAFGWVALRTYTSRQHRVERFLFLVWAFIIFMMAMTQVRFNYYLAVVIAVLNGWLFGMILQSINFPSLIEIGRDAKGSIGSYQVLIVFMLFAVILVPLIAPVGPITAVNQAERSGPGSVTVWSESTSWLSENTPYPGTYGDANNPMEYYGAYEPTNDFNYDEGVYGVISWWDYGHWITVLGERIPHSNPFQQGARTSSAYLLADNETRANLILDALPTVNSPYTYSNEELAERVNDQSPDEAAERIRYVMIDDEMAAEKFPAVATFTGPGPRAYIEADRYKVGEQNATLESVGSRYDQTMLTKLYRDDANGMSHYRLVHETNQYTLIGSSLDVRGRQSQTRIFNSFRIGGWEEQAAQIQRQVQASNRQGQALRIGQGQYVYNAQLSASVKTFERVEGAVIKGESNSTSPITIFTELQVTNTNRTFQYFQRVEPNEDGSFQVTVPYATGEYLGVEEGYTETNIRANGNYSVFSGSALFPEAGTRVDVPERAVLEGETISIELEPLSSEGDNSNNSTTSHLTDTAVSIPAQ